MDQNPNESAPLDPSSRINESRRRRTHRLIVPSGKTERAIYVNDVAKRLVPGLDFYLFSLLCGAVLGAAILMDHPAIYILAALLGPFMSPLIGLGFSTAVGSFRFFLQSLGSLLIGSAMVFAGGAISGWASRLFSDLPVNQASYHISYSAPDFILLAIGTILAITSTIKTPKKRSLIASVALAFEVYVPVGVAGFGLTSGLLNFFTGGLRIVGINILLVIMLGTFVLIFFRLRPSTFFGYLLTAVLLGGAAYALFMSSALKTAMQPQVTSSAVFTKTIQQVSSLPAEATSTPEPPTATRQPASLGPTATNTLVPTRTPTVTNTPKQNEIYAVINEPQGVYMHENPCTDDEKCPKVIPALSDKTPVLVLARTEDSQWYQVQTGDGIQGWVMGIYLSFE